MSIDTALAGAPVSPSWWLQHEQGCTFLMTALGAFSVFHPQHVFTGSGWDAQLAASFFLPRPPRSVLLLGLGGGTVARQYRALYPRARIVAVERDAEVIDVARRCFDVGALNIDIAHCPAETYIERTSLTFDVIVDDAWPFENPEQRAAMSDPGWPQRLKRRLRPNGLMALNVYHASFDPGTTQLAARLKLANPCTREVGLAGRLTTVLAAGDALRDGRQARREIGTFAEPRSPWLAALRFRSL